MFQRDLGPQDLASSEELGGNSAWKSRFSYLGVFFLALVVHLVFCRFNVADGVGPWLDADYGMLTNNGLRILRGGMLYRDIWTIYTPATDYFVSLVFLAAGESILALRIVLAFAGAVTSLLVFHCARVLTSAPIALAAVGLTFLVGPVCLNYPYPSWFCIPLGISALLVEHRAWKTGRGWLHIVSGAIAGATFSFKPNWGIFTLASLICVQAVDTLFQTDRPLPGILTTKKAMPAILAVTGCLPVLSLVLIKDHFTLLNIVVFALPPAAVVAVSGTVARERLEKTGAQSISLVPSAFSCGGFAAVALPWIGYLLIKLGPTNFYESVVRPAGSFAKGIYVPLPEATPEALVLILFFVLQCAMMLRARIPRGVKLALSLPLCAFGIVLANQAVLLAGRSLFVLNVGDYDRTGFAIACYLPLAVHLGAAFLLVNAFRDPDEIKSGRAHLLLCLWVYSVATFTTLYPLVDTYHLLWTMPPVVVFGGYFIVRSMQWWKMKEDTRPERYFSWVAGFALPVFVPLFVVVFFGLPILRLYPNEFARVPSRGGGIMMPRSRADSINAVVKFIDSNTVPDEYIFDMTGSFFYFLADRRSPTRWGHFYAGLMGSAEIEESRRNLETLKPRLVITSLVAEWNISTHYPALYSFINLEYKPLRRFGDYTVLALREDR